MAARKIIGLTLVSLAIMSDSAMALTVIDTNLQQAGSDWTSNSSLNSISDVGAATCGGLDADALQSCLDNTDFDINLQNSPNVEPENLDNNQTGSNDTNNQIIPESSEPSVNGSNTDNDNGANNTSNSVISTQNTESNNVFSQSTNYQVEEKNEIEAYALKAEQKTDNAIQTDTLVITEKNKTENKETVAALPVKPVKKYIKKPIVQIQTIPHEDNEKQNGQKVLEVLNKVSLEMNTATADIFTDWAKSNNSSYQADPWLIYLWFALAGFQSLFIISYLVGNKLSLEKFRWKK